MAFPLKQGGKAQGDTALSNSKAEILVVILDIVLWPFLNLPSQIPEVITEWRCSSVSSLCWRCPLLRSSLLFCFVFYICVVGAWETGGPCPVSHFCPEGASFPLACRAGTYNNLTRQAACFPCAAGYYCPENTTSYSVNPCPAGFYCPKGEMGTKDEVNH